MALLCSGQNKTSTYMHIFPGPASVIQRAKTGQQKGEAHIRKNYPFSAQKCSKYFSYQVSRKTAEFRSVSLKKKITLYLHGSKLLQCNYDTKSRSKL